MITRIGEYIIRNKNGFFYRIDSSTGWTWESELRHASFFKSVKEAKEAKEEINERWFDEAEIYYCVGTFNYRIGEAPVTHDDVR